MFAISALSTDINTRAVWKCSSQILTKTTTIPSGSNSFMYGSGNAVTRIKMTKMKADAARKIHVAKVLAGLKA
jgi:hypothetical protein